MALNIGRGNLAGINGAISSGALKAGDIVVTKDYGNELVLIERDNTQVVVGVGTVKNPSYDAETRTITLPVKQADGTTQDFVINLGKDNVVTSGIYNPDTQELELTLVSGDVIKIPATALVDVYTGDTTDTAVVTVSSDNKITTAVKLSTAAAGNLLKADSTGLYVVEADFVATKKLITDAEAAAKKYTDDEIAEEVTARDGAIATAIATEVADRNTAIGTAIATEVADRNTAIATAKGEAETTAKNYTDTQVGNEATARDNAIALAINDEVTARNAAIATAKGEALTYTDEKMAAEVTARDTAIATAKSGAEATAKSYTDTQVAAEVTARDAAIATAVGNEATARDAAIATAIATEVTNRDNAIATAKAEAIAAAKTYTDEQIADMKDYVDDVAETIGVKWVDFGA